jgi:hypothetical protein
MVGWRHLIKVRMKPATALAVIQLSCGQLRPAHSKL